MIGKFFKNFYFLSKLTTTLVLFIVVLFLGYVFLKAYQRNNNNEYSSLVEEKINNLSVAIQNNSKELSQINQKISTNETFLKQVNKTLNEKFIDNESNALSDQFNFLLEENKNLQKKIEDLSNLVNHSNFSLNNKEESKKSDKALFELIALIELKYENGLDVREELLLLDIQDINVSKKAYIEELLVLSDKQFIGIEKLKIEFDKLMKEFLNEYYLKKNKYLVIEYLSTFFSIEPNTNSDFQNKILENFSIIKIKLHEKDVKSSLKYLSAIENADIYFQAWIKEANNYINFKNNLKLIYKS